MHLKSIVSFFLCMALTCSSPAQTLHVYSLKECVDIAIRNNLSVKQNGLIADNARLNLKEARAQLLPNLAANLNHGSNQGRSIDPFTNTYINQNILYGNYNIGTNVILFNGGQIKNIIASDRYSVEAGKMDLKAAEDNVTLNVILAYLQVLNNKDLLVQATGQALLTEQQVNRSEKLNKEGAIVPAQLYDLKGQLANDQLAVISASGLVQTALLNLTQLMNVPFDPSMDILSIPVSTEPADYKEEANTIYQKSLTTFSPVLAAGLKKQVAQENIRVARSGTYPQLTLGGGLNTNYSNAASRQILLNKEQVPSGDLVNINGNMYPVVTTKSNFKLQSISYGNQFSNNYSTSVTLNLHIPIFSGLQNKTKIALAKNDLKNATYVEENQKVLLQQGIELAFNNMNVALKRFTKLQEQVAAFEESFRSAEIRFNNGVINQVDYLIAKNNLDRSKTNLITAQYDFLFQSKILDYYKGVLIL